METLEFRIAGCSIPFIHNLLPWEMSNPNICGYISQAGLDNPMWYTDAVLMPPDKPGCTREQAERAIEAHHAWLAEVMLDPARLAEVRAMLALKEAQSEVEQAERVLTLRRERVSELQATLASLRGVSRSMPPPDFPPMIHDLGLLD